jgi:hypothetical protein
MPGRLLHRTVGLEDLGPRRQARLVELEPSRLPMQALVQRRAV